MTHLRRLRIATGLSSADFARHVGVSVDMMGRWERGVNVPSEASARKLARVLGDMLGRKVTVEEVRRAL